MTERVKLQILNVSCWGSGARTIERRLARVRGVVRVYVNPATEAAYVEYDPAQVGRADLNRALEEIGLGFVELARRQW